MWTLCVYLSATATNTASTTTMCKARPGITLAGMINATKLKGTKLKDEKYLFLGAGSAGIGLAELLCSALVTQDMTLQEAQARVFMFDVNGLLESTRKDKDTIEVVYHHVSAFDIV